MTNMTLADAYSIVDDNFDQTNLVEMLFDECVFTRWMIQYIHEEDLIDEDEEDLKNELYLEDFKSSNLPDIYQWVVMPKLWECDFIKLLRGWIPVLRTDCGDWIGITSYGSHYDIQIYLKLIKALFNIDTDYQGIRAMKKGR